MTPYFQDPSRADNQSPSAEGGEGEAKLHYIAQISGELAQIARASEFPMLAYLLSMAREEASEALAELRRQNEPGRRKRR